MRTSSFIAWLATVALLAQFSGSLRHAHEVEAHGPAKATAVCGHGESDHAPSEPSPRNENDECRLCDALTTVTATTFATSGLLGLSPQQIPLRPTCDRIVGIDIQFAHGPRGPPALGS